MRVGGELMTKVDSPMPGADSWPTWPGSKVKAFILASSSKRTRKVLMLWVSWTVSRMVATSGR